ncbi:Ig-like domain-containing protein [Aquabacterium sp.]|uniref:Ig-like domain-containing protein n=1 Tax=Aquabacterium sp. TaxID=1872578 RepID=UPI003782E3F7
MSLVLGQYGYMAVIHEIGHTLGLDHMGDYDGEGSWTPSSYQDSSVLSVMSYFGPRDAAALYSPDVMQADWTDAAGTSYSPQTPMLNDVAAIQSIYGASTTTRTGNTVYGFGSNVSGSTAAIYDFTQNAHPVLTIFDSGGQDTLNLSGWNTPSRIDLRGGGFSSTNDLTNNIAISYDTVIEDAVGGGGNDVITGNAASNQLVGGSGNDELYGLAGDDTLIGGAGNDFIDGGDGSADTAVFDGVAALYSISVSGGTVTLSGPSGIDRVTNVERFRFADLTRLLTDLVPGADTTAPLLQSLNPVDGGGPISVGANLVISFNEPVRAGSGAIEIHFSDGTLWRSIASSDTQQLQFSGNTLTIDPAANLPASRGFYLTVGPGAVADLAGNPFAGWNDSASWNFSSSAVDNTAPRIVSLSPADDATKVALKAALEIDFDEAVVAGSGNIVLQRAGQASIAIPVGDGQQVRIQGNVVTIDPTADFASGASYTVTIDGGAFRDAAGNAFTGLGGNSAWNFSTVAPIAGDDYPMSVDTTGVLRTTGSIVGARIDAANDGDMFKVDLVRGTLYRFDMLAASAALNPYLVLYGPLPGLELLGYDDDSGTGSNAQLYYTPSVSGTYYVAASDNAEHTGNYNISASRPTDDYPASTDTPGVLLTTGSLIFGVISAPTDSDMFAVDLTAGNYYTIDLQRSTDGLVDPYLLLFNGGGELITFDNDGGGQGNAQLNFAPTASGRYYVSAADFSTGMGAYRLQAKALPLLRGSDGADTLQGSATAEALSGGPGDDRLGGGGGDDVLDGGDGIDTALYTGARAGYALMPLANGWAVSDSLGSEGRDVLHGIERLQFADGKLALDLGGNAGDVARILGVVFGPASVHEAAYVGIGLGLRDGGMSYEALMQLALDARLGANATSADVVNLLYTNLVGTGPGPDALALYTSLLDDGSYTPATLALLAAEQELNLANIDLAGLVQTGLAYS